MSLQRSYEVKITQLKVFGMALKQEQNRFNILYLNIIALTTLVLQVVSHITQLFQQQTNLVTVLYVLIYSKGTKFLRWAEFCIVITHFHSHGVPVSVSYCSCMRIVYSGPHMSLTPIAVPFNLFLRMTLAPNSPPLLLMSMNYPTNTY